MDFTRKRRLGCAATLAFVATAALSGRAARATEVVTRLDYRAAPGCPGVAAFSAVVAERLGYNPFRNSAPQQVVVRIDSSGKALEGRLEWRDAAGVWIGEQRLPSRTGNCAELVRAIGFALAVQFQLMATVAAEPRAQPLSPPPSPSPSPQPLPGRSPAATSPPALPPNVAPTPAPEVAPAMGLTTPPSLVEAPTVVAARPPETVISGGGAGSSDRRSSEPSIAVGAGAAVALGAATSAVGVGRVLGTLEWPHALVELAGEFSLPSTTRQADGMGFSQHEFFGSLAGCGVLRPWGACLVAKAGDMRVTGQGIDVPATSNGLMLHAGVRLMSTHMLGSRFQITAHADGLARVIQGTVTLDSMAVWTTPRFTALFGIDVGVRFR